jgi:homoserine O-acetyltransferase/O-succinyltransferase
MTPSPVHSTWTTQGNPQAQQAHAWFDHCAFRNGQTLDRVRMHYSTLGRPHHDAHGDIDNAVLVLHWTGADGTALHSPGFMQALFGPGCPLSEERFYLIFADAIGHGKSSKPSDGLKARFPHYGYRDSVDLQHRVVTEVLGIRRLRAILGLSMGGMHAWQWAQAHPEAMDGIMPVASFPHRISGRNLLWRRMAIAAIRTDPEWQEGNYSRPPRGLIQGYGLLRMMIDGVPHLQSIVADAAGADQFISQAALQAQGIDANDILYALEASADYDPQPHLSAVRTKVFALNFDDDEFNPQRLGILEALMPEVPKARFVVQAGTAGSFGHLSMAHPEIWAAQVAEFVRWLG